MPNGLKLTMLVRRSVPKTGKARDDEASACSFDLKNRLLASLEVENQHQQWPKDKLRRTTINWDVVELRSTRSGKHERSFSSGATRKVQPESGRGSRGTRCPRSNDLSEASGRSAKTSDGSVFKCRAR